MDPWLKMITYLNFIWIKSGKLDLILISLSKSKSLGKSLNRTQIGCVMVVFFFLQKCSMNVLPLDAIAWNLLELIHALQTMRCNRFALDCYGQNRYLFVVTRISIASFCQFVLKIHFPYISKQQQVPWHNAGSRIFWGKIIVYSIKAIQVELILIMISIQIM